MNEIIEKPKTYKYILAWVIASIVSNILIRIIDMILSVSIVSNESDLILYFIISGLLSIPIFSGSFIVIYNLFKSLNINKVMIYIYILGGLGLFASMIQTLAIFNNVGIVLPVIIVTASIFSFIISVLIIRFYYKSKPNRWY
ncbi:hypothetical protein OAH28_04040 [Hyphomicrobiales bacterium]|jgi:hypothetical protein|nr:hypothetical protein [Hyphomicrobiales bacterium]